MKNERKPIRYGIIGLGWGQTHIKQVQACSDATLVAVADMHQEKRDDINGTRGFQANVGYMKNVT